MTDKFQPDFYVTCATVIPVLFLAVAVQGRAYESVLRAYMTADRAAQADLALRMRSAQSRRERAKQYLLNRLGSANFRSSGLVIVAVTIVIAGTAGEFIALLTLYRGSEVGSDRAIVLVMTLILLATVAAIPVLAVFTPSPQASPGEAKAADKQPGEPGPDDGAEP